MELTHAVFYSPHDPQAGVLAEAFARAERVGGVRRPAVRAAARSWWEESSAGLGGSPLATTVVALRSARRHQVGDLFAPELEVALGPDNAAAAQEAEEESWSAWAWRTGGEAKDGAITAVKTVYGDTKAGVERTYEDTKAGLRRAAELPANLLKIPERIADKPRDYLKELKGPLTAAAVGVTVVTGLYLLTRD